MLYENGDGVEQSASEALKWYRLAAEQGYVSAQLNLGFFYHYGENATIDMKEAVKWYEMAATQGDLTAITLLAEIYATGDGVAIDQAKSFDFYLHAARQGDLESIIQLAQFYEKGIYVKEDVILAYAHYYAWANMQNPKFKKGYHAMVMNINLLNDDGSSTNITENLLSRLTPDQIDEGNSKGLEMMYEFGYGG